MKKNTKVKLGRKPSEDPKVAVIFYIKRSTLNKIGGKEGAREIAIKACEKASKQK